MDSSISEHHHHHHRKRKRSRHLYHSSYSFFSVRSLILCFSFLLFLYLLSYRVHLAPVDFRPVLVVPGFPLFSSSSSSSNSIQLFSGAKQPSFLVEDRVFFPDHVLLLVSRMSRRADELDCVYYPNRSGNSGSGDAFDGFTFTSVNRNALSVDEYNEFQSIVRCPLPPENYSAAAVNLKPRRRRRWIGGEKAKTEVLRGNQTLRSWEMVAYAAVLDGNTTVVFVKGLNLRADRESDPTPFTCHFGLGNWERDGRGYVLTTKAITAAQEVVRCSLPASIRMNPSKAQGIRVTIGITPQVHAKAHSRLLVPSVAKIFGTGEELRKKREKMSKGKYELCVCTMVWNQASALREWVVYHAWLGIERWFIYDNNSDDGIQEVINELNRGNYNVSRQVWPWIKTQEAGFSHCALRARDECNWVGFMDVDEFFYFAFPTPRSHRFGTLGFPDQNALRNLLTNFSSSTTIAEIRTACHSFGPSGLSSPPSQGVTVGYTCRLQSPERHKSIVRPDALDTTLLNVVHHFHLKKGFTYLNLPQSTVVINHYKYQVWESFRTKFYRRVATYVADWQENQNEGSRDRAPGLGTEPIEPPNWRLQFCEVWDTGMRDFVLANLADPATGLLPWERTSL